MKDRHKTLNFAISDFGNHTVRLKITIGRFHCQAIKKLKKNHSVDQSQEIVILKKKL